MTRKQNKQIRGILSLAAVAVISSAMSSSTVLAQYRTGSDGHANDANTRVGSGGYNGGGSTNPYAVNGNQMGNNIVTGNVTAGREFRGFVPYTPAGAFSQTLPNFDVDRFVSGSSGVPIPGVYNNNNAQNVLPFYGPSFGALPPPGISNEVTPNGQYLPAVPETRSLGDVRLGNPFTTVTIEQPRPGQTVMAGPVDTSQQPTIITASPLYGVRMWRPGDVNDQQFLDNYTDIFDNQHPNKEMESSALNQMRAELKANATDQAAPAGSDTSTNPNNPTPTNTTQTPDSNDMNKPMNRSFDLSSPQVQNQPTQNATPNVAVSTGLRTGETSGTRITTNIPVLANTSPQYRELQARLNAYRVGASQTEEVDRNRALQAQQRAIAELKGEKNPGNNTAPGATTPGATTPGATTPGATTPGATPGANSAPGANPTPGASPVNPGTPAAPGGNEATAGNPATPVIPKGPVTPKVKPLQINSFAKDMKQSAAADLMKQAEDEMRNGKFTRALDKYDMVEEVAPNDPLVSLGRATAELGASYYTRADAHLRDAFTRNQELLLGQYDLHAMLGEDRLQFLVRDLKDLATKNKQDPRYPFLLAYIAYNTGNEKNAAAYLDLADKRSGGRDPFFKLLHSRWNLPDDTAPETPAQPDMNK